MSLGGEPVYPASGFWIGTGRYLFTDAEREAVNGFPCPVCGAGVREPCKAGDEFEAAVTHIARLSLAGMPLRKDARLA